MSQQLTYGRTGQIQFHLSDDSLRADFTAPHGQPLTDVARQVALALAQPLEFPPLEKAIVPEDRVAIALEDDLPQAGELVAGIVAALLAAGVEANRVFVAQTKAGVERDERDPRELLAADIRDQVGHVVHDPAVREELAFLAANRAGEAVYLNRSLCDADLVIPVGCVRRGYWNSRSSAFSGLYPAFSDRAAQTLLRQQLRAVEEERKKPKRVVQDEVGWLLGSLLTVQVIPGGGESILHVLR